MLTQTIPITLGPRYRLIAALGSGGMGTVYRAQDRLTGKTVALKQMRASTEDLLFAASLGTKVDVRLALAQEFQTLASLRHPNIISVLDYGFDADKQPYFTMDLLEHSKIILEAAQGLPNSAKIELLGQILQALAYLHRRGIVHRDLKPSNVLVIDEQVKLLDFGLSLRVGQAALPSGTLAYMAPEVLDGGVATIAADLYAVGMIAYELLAGHHPFRMDSTTRLIEDIRYTSPNLVSAGIDPGLAGILDMLLAKMPSARFTSASEVIKALNAVTGLSLPLETQITRESFLQAATLIGRDTELAQLSNVLNRAIGGKGSSWLIAGESGIGKSRLIDELRTQALVQGVLVTYGQAISEGGLPFQLWRDVVRWLVILTDMTDLEASVLKLLVTDIADLLERQVPDAPQLDPQSTQTRLLSTIIDIVKRQNRPMLITLDDLHWADSESLALLQWLNRITPELPLLVVGSYRDDESADLPSSLPDMQILKLLRLSDTDIAALSQSMLGDVGSDPQVLNVLQRETEGNIFFLVEVVRALAEEAGQLDKIGSMTLPTHIFTGGVQRIVRRRLERVPAAARPLLTLAAVAGRLLDLPVLRAAHPDVNLDNWLANCANAAVLEVQADQWRFAHDKLREGILSDLSANERPDLHRKVALAIESAYPNSETQIPTLAYHWAMAGNTENEAHYTELAGEQAAARYANDEAARYLRRALALAGDPSKRLRLLLKLEAVLEFTGNLAEAESLCREALSLVPSIADELLKAHCKKAFGHLLWAKGIFTESAQYLKEARTIFEDLGDQEALASTAEQLGVIHMNLGDNSLALRCLQESLEIAVARKDLKAQCSITTHMGKVHWSQGNHANALKYGEQALQIARQIGDRLGIAQALWGIGNASLGYADFSRAFSSFQETLNISQETGYRRGVCLMLCNIGSVYSEWSAFDHALTCYKQYVTVSCEIDNRLGLAVGPLNIAGIYLIQKKYTEAERLGLLAVRVCRKLNSVYYLGGSLYTMADLFAQQEKYVEAQTYNNEALKIARRTSNVELGFQAKVLSIRLRVFQHQTTVGTAIAEIETLLPEWEEPLEQATLHYEAWRLDKSQDRHRQAAADLYLQLYRKTWKTEHGQRYTELTGEHVGLPPAYPQLPQVVSQHPIDLEALLARVDEIVAGWGD